uniref:Kinesin motor domain-containing protein n=1 Tax=Amphiprion ocellaris TaxID=80972 RepID=A0AAQ5ZDX0_AMPOC
MSSVRVAVRVRPLNKREKQLSSKVVIHMKGNTTTIHKPPPVRLDQLKDSVKSFSFDFSYDSSDRGRPAFASQKRIFQDLGTAVLKAAFDGFNACVFAYGQTGSGKSYTMMGHKEDKGLIPRICEGLFTEISHRRKSDGVSFHTEVSYLEIYNEHVQDLLRKRTPPTDGGLRVREHPRDGPYVENLSKHLVHNHSDIEDLIVLGNANRTKASTAMNDYSSRSHAIFTIMFTQAGFDAELPRETLSKIHLVDLAGSERADAMRTTGIRLKESANINKSLVTLGNVISALADLSVGGQSAKKKHIFIPYRDSVLTWLLKDSLGGNSMTTMIATISPADVNYGESLNTLRYATRAKNIMNSPTVNEDGSVKVIRELQAEVTRLRRLLEEATQVFHGELPSSMNVKDKLHQNEAKVEALTKEWTRKWRETQSILQEETVALRKAGSGVILDCQLPHLIGIDEGLLGTGVILYYLKEGRTLIGSAEASCSQGIGAIIQLGEGPTLRFNHPAEVSQLREKCQSGLQSVFSLSLTDLSKSTENPAKVMLQNAGGMEEKLNQQGLGRQQVLESLRRCNQDIKRLPKENRGAAESLFIQMDAETAESKGPSVCLTSSPKLKFMTTAIPGRYLVPHTSFELDGETLQGGVSTRDGQEQERDLCHKSGRGLVSERLQRKAQTGPEVASYKTEEVWSGDASLQQKSVLGPGDGCGMKPEGNANEIQGVVTDCYKGRPGSGGISLGSMSHLQSRGESSSMSVLPQTSTHSQPNRKPLSSEAACCPPKETAFEGQFSCREMDESNGLKEIPGVCVTEAAAASVQSSGLGSLFNRVSWIVQDAGRFLWNSPTTLQQVMEVRLQPVGARWSSHVISLVKESNVLSVVKDSQVFSMVRGSFIFSLFRDSRIFSMVKGLPLIQHIQMDITQHLQPDGAAQVIQGCIHPGNTQLPVLTQTQTLSKVDDVQLIPEDIWRRNRSSTDPLSSEEQDLVDSHGKQEDKRTTELLPLEQHSEKEVTCAPKDIDESLENQRTFQIATQTLTEFPDSLLNLQSLSLQDMMDTLNSVIPMSEPILHGILALHWLNVAKCSQPESQPALLILMETGLYALTMDSGVLVLFHYLPLLQLKDIQIGLAGYSLRLMGTTEESILGVYTHSQDHTKELCWAILDVMCPGDSRVSQHPLFNGDLLKMSLDWQVYVPDLLLDDGLRVCCQFQKSLADLVCVLHCNMDQETVTLGEVQILLYTSVAVHISSSAHREHLVQFLLTDTHLGLVQEDIVYRPAPHSAIAPSRPQFHDLRLRQCSDVRCMLLHDEHRNGSVRLDIIFGNARGRGHPESVTKATALPAHTLNSSPHTEVWKLTFGCSAEAACLINHLSNV